MPHGTWGLRSTPWNCGGRPGHARGEPHRASFTLSHTGDVHEILCKQIRYYSMYPMDGRCATGKGLTRTNMHERVPPHICMAHHKVIQQVVVSDTRLR